ncbi:MAG: DUF937 domain-containing protein [Oscillospiraceae bacterium]|nr:DUF937 domain-containing protein [Oscillospiraceae bacterium]
MNLLSVLLKSLLSEQAVKALAKKTGLDGKSLTKLLPLAIPVLMKALTKNASSEAGASSLLAALTQHTGKATAAEQIADADTDDGDKIIGHIFGSKKKEELQALSAQSGLSESQVSSALSGIAPTLLSTLSAATQSAKPASAGKVDLSDGLDLGDVMAMLGGARPSASDLLGGLFGGKAAKEEKDSAINGASLLSSLLAMKK